MSMPDATAPTTLVPPTNVTEPFSEVIVAGAVRDRLPRVLRPLRD